MQLSFNILHLHCYIKDNPIGITLDDFRCEDVPPDISSNVTELQFCDGMSNCTDGSDEPQYCPAGIYTFASCELHVCVEAF